MLMLMEWTDSSKLPMPIATAISRCTSRKAVEQHLPGTSEVISPLIAPLPRRIPQSAVPRRWGPWQNDCELDAWYLAQSGEDAVSSLQVNSNVSKLALNEVTLSDRQVQQLADALRTCTKLRRLRLERCKITDDGAAFLAKALERNDTLETLSLDGNQVGDVGAGAFAQTLRMNETLTSLGLGKNRIRRLGCSNLADALEDNHTLRALEITDIDMDTPLKLRLQKLLKRNKGPSKVVTLSASLQDSSASMMCTVSCTGLTGAELSRFEDLRTDHSLMEFRRKLAVQLQMPKQKLALILPDGRCLGKSEDKKDLAELFGFASSNKCSSCELQTSRTDTAEPDVEMGEGTPFSRLRGAALGGQ